MKLSVDEKVNYAKIIFASFGKRKKRIDALDQNELQVLRNIYAQKIAFQTVNGSLPEIQQNIVQDLTGNETENPSLWPSICWCFYPENNREYFDIPSSLFIKRAFYPLLFWNSDFFQIDPQVVEHYGFTWMVFTYTIALFLASTLTQFFVDPVQYQQDFSLITQVLAIVFIFKLIEPMLHSCAIGCLGSNITSDECLMLSGYSLSIYILPTLFCMAPSIYWRTLLLASQAAFRTIFLFRNYETKLQSRKYLFLLLLIVIEIIYAFVVYRSLFMGHSLGYGFGQAFSAAFGTTPTDTQAVSSQAPANQTTESSKTSEQHLFFSRPINGYQSLRKFNW